MKRFTVLAAAIFGLSACGSHTSSGAVAVAQRFIAGVTKADSRAYCQYVGWMGSPSPPQPPTPVMLKLCEGSDLFLITGNCDLEATVSGASISSSQLSGDRATLKLSSGGQLQLQRISRWLVVNIEPSPNPPKLASGGCAGA